MRLKSHGYQEYLLGHMMVFVLTLSDLEVQS